MLCSDVDGPLRADIEQNPTSGASRIGVDAAAARLQSATGAGAKSIIDQ
ncbi:MAG: hypothetical protein QM784_08935 [Polyangiaceae bacterium]